MTADAGQKRFWEDEYESDRSRKRHCPSDSDKLKHGIEQVKQVQETTVKKAEKSYFFKDSKNTKRFPISFR